MEPSGSFWLGRIRKLHDPICNPVAQGKPVVEPFDNTFVFSFMDDFYHQRRLICDKDPSDGIISKGTVIQVLNMTSRNLLSMTSENDECCSIMNYHHAKDSFGLILGSLDGCTHLHASQNVIRPRPNQYGRDQLRQWWSRRSLFGRDDDERESKCSSNT